MIDANVFVSAALQRGPSHRIVQRWFAGNAFELIVSDGVLAEVEDVLTRPRLAKRITNADAVGFVRSVAAAAACSPTKPECTPTPSTAARRT